MSDPFQWLEELESPQSLSWVQKQNQETLQTWGNGLRFQELNQKALSVLNDQDKLVVGVVYRDEVYRLWKDEANPIGIWQKTSLKNFGPESQWKTLLNLDEYSKTVGQPTYLGWLSFLKGGSRVLLPLAPDGKDASVIREWDLDQNQFVENGFSTKLSKDHMDWVDQDHVLWCSTEEPTHCGYTSKIYSWKRGSQPELLMKIPLTSMSVWSLTFHDSKEQPHVFIGHQINWDETEMSYWNKKELIPTGLPRTARIYGFYQDRVLLFLEKEWESFPAGSILMCQNPQQKFGFQSADFKMIFEPSATRAFQDLSVFQEGIGIFFTEKLQNKIQIWTDQKIQEIPIPDGSSIAGLFSSVEKKQLFVVLQSFSIPHSFYQVENGQLKCLKKQNTHFQSDTVKAKQEWATSLDGTKVPYWVVYDERFQFPRPTLQYGYGGFMSSLFPSYSGIRGSLWIEGGGIFVLAQIRGGCEFGISWHETAKLENKQKSYDDFIAVSEDLIRKGYTTSKQLAINGRSNGGLLVGATVTQRPDLYGAAVIEVPLLDMIRYVELPPGSSWIGEYGDPRDPKFKDIILKYSPYQNVEKNPKYPPILIRTARSDDRVHPGHARKMAAKLQSLGHPCWFFEEEQGGHGSTPAKDLALQSALVFEFLIRTLN